MGTDREPSIHVTDSNIKLMPCCHKMPYPNPPLCITSFMNVLLIECYATHQLGQVITPHFYVIAPLYIINYILKGSCKIYQIIEYLCRSVEKWCTPLERRENVVHHMNKTNRHSKPIHTFKKYNSHAVESCRELIKASRLRAPTINDSINQSICFHTFKKHNRSRSVFPHLHKTKQVKICFHTFKKHKKVNPIDSRQIIPKVGLMLRILDLISLACLAGCEQ